MNSEQRRVKSNSSVEIVEECKEDVNAGYNQPLDMSVKVKSPSTSSSLASECQQSFDDRTVQAMNKVFGIDLLRKEIFGYFVQDLDLGMSDGATRRDVCSARLVQKSWLRDVNKQLFNSKRYLINLDFNFNKKNTKNVSKFAGVMENSILETIPPINLKIGKDFFRTANRLYFLDFLHVCATAVMDLYLVIPKNGGSMNLSSLPQGYLTFPRLICLQVHFSKSNTTRDKRAKSNGSNSNFVPFIQSILETATTLDRIVFTSDCYTRKNMAFDGIKDLVFPRSLKQLVFKDFALNPDQMQVLLTNSFPHLTELFLNVDGNKLEDDIFFRILNKVKTTLRNFIVHDVDFETKRPVHFLQFPVMDALEVCAVLTAFVQPSQALEALLPNLNRMGLCHETVAGLRKWTDGSCFSTVTEVNVNTNDERSFTLEEMQVIHRAFPYIQTFTFSGEQIGTKALEYLFKEMSQLTKLKIWTGVAGPESSYAWNSLLIGAPVSTYLSLQESRQSFAEGKGIKNTSVSIKNLTALRELELCAYPIEDESVSESLISDLTFRMTLLQMPSLKFVHFAGGFMPSPNMTTYFDLLKTRPDSDLVYTYSEEANPGILFPWI